MSKLIPILLTLPLLAGCAQDYITVAEATEGLEEVVASTEAISLTYESIEISTSFTIGDAVEDAIVELQSFYESQVPCTTTTLEGTTLTIDYGTLADNCVYNGNTYAGVHAVTLTRNASEGVEVAHAWTDFTNGTITLNGTADVTWSGLDSAASLERHVVHNITWDKGSRSVTASGDRRQTLVEPALGIAGGIEINGTRSWTTDKGTWSLDIAGVQIRGQDPAPQAGSYILTTPADKEMTLSFTRFDADSIVVKISGMRHDRSWLVSSTGDITDG